MNARTQEIHVGINGQTPTSPARAIRAHLATVLATAALFVAVAGVVYGPKFTTKESIATQRAQTLDLLATVGSALQQQSPQCLLQTC
jgi:hypothetical protein